MVFVRPVADRLRDWFNFSLEYSWESSLNFRRKRTTGVSFSIIIDRLERSNKVDYADRTLALLWLYRRRRRRERAKKKKTQKEKRLRCFARSRWILLDSPASIRGWRKNTHSSVFAPINGKRSKVGGDLSTDNVPVLIEQNLFSLLSFFSPERSTLISTIKRIAMTLKVVWRRKSVVLFSFFRVDDDGCQSDERMSIDCWFKTSKTIEICGFAPPQSNLTADSIAQRMRTRRNMGKDDDTREKKMNRDQLNHKWRTKEKETKSQGWRSNWIRHRLRRNVDRSNRKYCGHGLDHLMNKFHTWDKHRPIITFFVRHTRWIQIFDIPKRHSEWQWETLGHAYCLIETRFGGFALTMT